MVSTSLLLGVLILLQVLSSDAANGRPKAVVANRVHMLVNDDISDNFTVKLDGSQSIHAQSYFWSESLHPSRAWKSKIHSPTRCETNVTIDTWPGTYKFKLTVTGSNSRSSHAFSEVVLQEPTKVGMYALATSIVTELFDLKIKYLFMSHHFLRADNYFPNVAEYFRKHSNYRAEMLDQVMDYIQDKQATIDLLNPYPPNYVKLMMSEGLRERIDVTAHMTKKMKSAFKLAIKAEKELGRDLTTVAHYADNNLDVDLSHFAAANLLPHVTKAINEHTNHYKTVLHHATEAMRPLTEFLFDKRLKSD